MGKEKSFLEMLFKVFKSYERVKGKLKKLKVILIKDVG